MSSNQAQNLNQQQQQQQQGVKQDQRPQQAQQERYQQESRTQQQKDVMQEGTKGENKIQKGQFVDTVQKKLQELEDSFKQQISELREKLYQGPKKQEKIDIEEPKQKKDIKPVHYEVKYSTASTYKDGKREIKEHIEVKNPEQNLIADRVPGKEEFDVKIQKQGEQQPITKRIKANEIQHEVEKVYCDLQNKSLQECEKMGLPMSQPSCSLFGSHDLPMLGASSMLPIEEEGGLFGTTLSTKPACADFFDPEIRHIEREMDYMARRMEHEMRRFYNY